jgi:hypothetical protein
MARNDLDEEDWSDDADATDAESFPCPECRAEIFADLDHCPQCGYWLTDADRRAQETGLFASHRVRLIAAVLLVIFVLSLLAELFLL